MTTTGTKAELSDKWLVLYDDGQEVLGGQVAKDRFEAMEFVQKAGEASGGEIGANVVSLEMAASAPALLQAAKAVFAEFLAPGDTMKASTMKKLRQAIERAEGQA